MNREERQQLAREVAFDRQYGPDHAAQRVSECLGRHGLGEVLGNNSKLADYVIRTICAEAVELSEIFEEFFAAQDQAEWLCNQPLSPGPFDHIADPEEKARAANDYYKQRGWIATTFPHAVTEHGKLMPLPKTT